MLHKSHAIDRLLREHPELSERRFGLPDIGTRLDGEQFNPTVQDIADAIDFYGFEVRDKDITSIPDIDLGNGNPTKYPPFPLAIEAMKKSLDNPNLYKYPYTEGDDAIRKILLDYIEEEGFINTEPYSYSDVDSYGLSVHNLTFLPSTSIAFNMVMSVISKPGDVVIVTGPNYGLFTIRGERAGAEVEVLPLLKEDNFLINPASLAKKIDEVNESLEKVYHRRKGYVPRVVAFLNANPNNPTGKVMGENERSLLEEIGNVCLDRGVFVIDDLVYRDVTYDEKNIAKPLATIPGMFRNTISLFGLSKSYGLASLRAGFVVADEVIIREVINRIFQGMDSAPDIVGHALAGSFNTSFERKKIYHSYFSELRMIYRNKYLLLKALVKGISAIDDETKRSFISNKIHSVIRDDDLTKQVLEGLLYTDFPNNLEPEAGFFAILDFTKLKGMKYEGKPILTEKDLLKFFYHFSRIRFLIGQSISWPYPKELVARVTFALEDEVLIKAFMQINIALHKLKPADDYVIRKNELKDQAQMAEIKIDSWTTAYDKIVASKYIKSLNKEELTERYIKSFSEYKDLVFVAEKNNHLLGYACFSYKPLEDKYDSELVSLYIRKEEANKGIGSALFLSVAKELLDHNCHNMIVWCFMKNTHAIEFYKSFGGVIAETKEAIIGNELYKEYGFYFDLKTVLKNN